MDDQPSPVESDTDGFFAWQRRQARINVAGVTPEDSPDDAARAIELGSATGVPPETIYPDVKSFEFQHKALLNSDLVASNRFLQNYFLNNAMSAKLSHDDVGPLDQASESFQKFNFSGATAAAGKYFTTGFVEATQGMKEGFGEERLSSWMGDYAHQYPMSAAVLGATTMIPEAGLRAMSGAIRGVAELVKARTKVGADAVGLNGDLLSRDLAGMVEAEAMGLSGRHGMPSPEQAAVIRGAVNVAKPYLERGEMPPTGIHPWIDSVYKAAAKDDAAKLDAVVKDSAATATRERAPDFYAEHFADDHVGEAKIRIDANAIARLYGESRPEVDDNVLGWIPNLAERLDATAGSGGYIDVPLKDYAAKVDPEVHKELRDDILVRDHGFTLREAEAVKDQPKEEAKPEGEEPQIEKPQGGYTLDAPTQVVRGSAGLEPLLAIGDRKLELRKRAIGDKGLEPSITGDEYGIHDENGKKVGWLDVVPSADGKQLFVKNVGGFEHKGFGPNSFGPALTRSLLRQLKEQYPDIEKIGGFRISGAREEAGTTGPVTVNVRTALAGDAEQHQGFRDLLASYGAEVHPSGAQAAVVPGELWTAHENEIADAIHEELARIAPGAKRFVSHELANQAKTSAGQSVKGLFSPKDLAIFVSLDSKDPLGFAGHEAIHYLREAGLFSDAEWSGLESVAQREGWREKYNIDSRYAKYSDDIKNEEAIAEGFREWMGTEEKAAPEVQGLFEKLKAFFASLKERLAKITGKADFDWKDLFQKVESGEVGARDAQDVWEKNLDPRAAIDGEPEPIQVKLPFAEGKAIGIRQDLYNRYMKLIQQRHDADLKADFESAYDRERRTQTKEWKENEKAVREQVEAELDEKPNVLVDRYMSQRGGDLKIDPMSLSERNREILPKEYMRRTNAVSADYLASYFGYPSGDALVEHLAEVAAPRKELGLTHSEYMKQLTESEVQRRMEAQYGFLQKNILEDAKDRALSQNQIDILHEETVALAEQAGITMPIERSALVRELRNAFLQTPTESIDSKVWLKAAGKAGDETQEALLKGDYQEAFKAKQRQHNATLNAKWANAYEKEQRQLDKTAKRFAKREAPKSIEPEFVNHIQDQLRRVGYGGTRSWANIKENLRGQTIAQFAEEHLAGSYGLRDLPVAEAALDANFGKPIGKLSYEEFRQFKGMIDSLVANGRDIRQYGKEGEKVELEEALDQAVGQVETFDGKAIAYGEQPGLTRTFIARSTAMPTVLNRFDRGNRRGFFNRMMYRFSQGDNEQAAWERKIVSAWKEVGDYGDLSRKLTPPPMLEGWKYPGFTIENLQGMIQNMGNKSNFVKMAKGWGAAKPEELWDWVVANSSREDWQRAQAMGDKIFNEIVKETDKVEERVNGYTLDKLPLTPFEIEFHDGEAPLKLKGWYHPLIPDQVWYGEHQKVRGGAYDDSNFGHIMTSNGYTKSRTGAVYPVDLGFGSLPGRLSQMIHDITHREIVLDAQKVLKNPRFLNAVTEHYGKEYSDLMVPFLRDMAGQAAMPSANWARMEQWSEYLRGNAMSTYIGFNPSTPMKHAPTAFFMSLRAGGMDFLNAYKQQWLGERAADGNPWGEFAMKHSEELQRRERNWLETFGGNELRLDNSLSVREKMIYTGQWMVAKSDMFSARALWIGSFQKALREDPNIRDAIDIANADVRRQHGSTAWSNKPEIVRQSGSLHGWMTSVYGFMGERFQRMIETMQKVNDTYDLVKDGELRKATGKVPGIMADYLTYMVSVGLWEEAATYALTQDHQSTGARLFNLMFGNIASSLVYIRDMYHAMQTGQSPSIGMLPSAIQDLQAPVRDLMKGRDAINRQNAGKTVKDFMTSVGIATGAVPKQFGNVIQFGMDYANRQAHPKSVQNVFRGLARGKAPEDRAKKE
jgi:hypothetical protein